MTAPTYTPLPTTPLRTMDPATFISTAHAFLAAFPTLQTEGDALGVFCEAQAAIAESAAQDILTSFTNYSGDMDALTSTGFYLLAAGLTNGWSGSGVNDFALHLQYDASNAVQIGYDGDAAMHVRSKVSGTWGAWGSPVASQSTSVWEAGTDTTESSVSAAKVNSAIGALNPFGNALLHVRDEKTSGTHGGSSVAGWNLRDINTTPTNEITGASVASNQITLPAGTYYIDAIAPAKASDGHQLVLYNVTDSTYDVVGSTERAVTTNQHMTSSKVRGRFTIAASKVFELRHYITTSLATAGLGQAVSSGQVEVYTEAQIWKL